MEEKNHHSLKTWLEKSWIIGIVVVVIIIGWMGWFLINKNSSQNEQHLFDNSKPGLWDLTVQTIGANGKQSIRVGKKCITQQEINQVKKQTLEQKFNTKNLTCTKISMNRKDLQNANFQIDCYAMQNNNKRNFIANGTIFSSSIRNEMHIQYQVDVPTKDGKNQRFKYYLNTFANRLGECK